MRKAKANSEQVVSIFFYMEKSYDLTWRHGNLMDIHEAGIEVRTFKIVHDFLLARSLKSKSTKFYQTQRFK